MKKKKNNIKSTKHAIKFANHGKRDLYLLFLREYRRVAKIYFDYLWDSGWEDQKIFFNISEDQLNIPKFIDRKLKEKLGLDTSLSARALSSCLIQVLGCVRSVTEQRRRQTYVLNKLKLEGKDYANLQRKIEKKSANQTSPTLIQNLAQSVVIFNIAMVYSTDSYNYILLVNFLVKLEFQSNSQKSLTSGN